MAVLVVGGRGFLGTHVCRILAERGEEVVSYDLGKAPNKVLLGEQANAVRQCSGDITDIAGLLETVKENKISGIIHMAAVLSETITQIGPYRSQQINVGGTLNVLEVARIMSLRRVIVISTGGVFSSKLTEVDSGKIAADETPYPFGDEVPSDAVYSLTKYECELITQLYTKYYDIDAACVRFTSVFGPGRYEMRVPTLLDGIVKDVCDGKALSLKADPNMMSTWEYVSDVASGISAAYQVANLHHSIYHVGSGIIASLGDLAKAIEKLLPDSRIKFRPGGRPLTGLVEFNGRTYYSGAANRKLDFSTTEKDLKWKPQFDLEAGLKASIDWFKEGKVR